MCCSPRKQQVKPCSLTMGMMAANAAVMLVLLLFPDLSFVREGLLTQSAGATHGALPLLNRETKVAPVNQVLAIRFGSRSRFASAGQKNWNELAVYMRLNLSYGASHVDSCLNSCCS